ncbi:UNVERIFIED_CONTAM: hypothetical protein GTU68_060062 [Idotea baltica]|nr:hypothetical protein [Idotea baltica]
MNPNFLKALEDYSKGEAVILIDDESRENEGDIVVATDCITESHLNFMEYQARGLVCVSISTSQAKRLNLSLQTENNNAPYQTAFTKSIALKNCNYPLESAKARVQCMRALASPTSKASDFTTPGNVYPLIANKSGTISRDGQTEGSHDLSRIAGFNASGVICEIVNKDGTMARGESLNNFASKYQLPIISVSDILKYRVQNEILLKEKEFIKNCKTDFGVFDVYVLYDEVDNKEHFVLAYGNYKDNLESSLVRIHSECLTGDVFGSRRCDCGKQLENSTKMIKEAGCGYIIYLRQEGRGIGLLNKIKAYQLQDQGLDTVEANECLGLDVDKRDYAVAAKILQLFSIKSVNLMTNNPDKINVISSFGIKINKRVPLIIENDPHSIAYIKTKRDKLGHML